jgi:CRISPR/Cas system-associated endoribonuclease Cas2
MNFFICYDISDDKRRLHLSKLLQRKGCKRIQKSVCIAIDFERSEMLHLKNHVDTLLNKRYTEGVLWTIVFCIFRLTMMLSKTSCGKAIPLNGQIYGKKTGNIFLI